MRKDVQVVEEGVGGEIEGATFDCDFTDHGDGNYVVYPGDDGSLVAYKSGFYDKAWNVIWSTTIGMERIPPDDGKSD